VTRHLHGGAIGDNGEKEACRAEDGSVEAVGKTITADSTRPPKDLSTKSAPVIVRSPVSKKVSPKGPASGMRMLTYFIHRAGKGLYSSRRKELERAKRLLHARIEQAKARREKKAA
jgi:hypothetical protein